MFSINKTVTMLKPLKYFVLTLISLFLSTSCTNKKSANNNQNTATPKVTLALKMESQLGEGAFWNHHTNQLYWVDILGKQLHIYNPNNNDNKTFVMPSRIGTVVPQTDSTAVVALEDGIYIQNTKNNSLTLLSDIEAKQTENRFNDGKCDPNGNLWVGSMHLAEKKPKGNLYKVLPNGNTTKMLDSITISNGIVWSGDAKTMYYIDTPTMNIRAFDFDATTSTISNERVAVQVDPSLGYPDGMAIDSENKIWVGMWNGNAVIRFDPDTGKVLDKIEIPAHNVTSCAFGGENFETLYITTARVDMTEDELKKYPLSGSIFKVKPGVKGVPSTLFKSL